MLKWLLSLIVFIIFFCPNLGADDIDNSYENHETGHLSPPFRPTRVKFSASLIKVEEIEAASQDNPALTAEFSLEISWPDSRLAKKNQDVHKVHVFQDDEAGITLAAMFNPKISVVGGEMTIKHQHLQIFPDGRVSLEQTVSVKVPANLKLIRFPFDSQTFLIRFASIYWDDKEVDLIQEIASAETIENPDSTAWHLNYRSFYVSKVALRKGHERTSMFNFIIYAERDPSYFIWRLLIPLMVIVFLSWNVFWLHEDKALALGNCFLFLLTVVTFHDTARSMLPVLSYFTFIDAIVFISYAFIIIPTVQVVSSIRLEDRGKIALMDAIRRACKWMVPVAYFLTISITALRYFLM